MSATSELIEVNLGTVRRSEAGKIAEEEQGGVRREGRADMEPIREKSREQRMQGSQRVR